MLLCSVVGPRKKKELVLGKEHVLYQLSLLSIDPVPLIGDHFVVLYNASVQTIL